MRRNSKRQNLLLQIRQEKRLTLYLCVCLAGILGVTLLVYGQDLQVAFGNALVFTSGNVGNYVLAVPLMSAVILHRKRHVLKAVIFRDDGNRWFSDPLGISVVLIAAVVFLYGSSTLYAPYYHMYSMVLFLIGATMIVFNYSTFRHVFFAIALLAFLQPPPGELIGGVAADISWISALILNSSLHLLGISADLNSNLGAPSFLVTKPGGQQNTFVIGEPSSGVFSTIGMSVFALFVAYISGGKFWKRATIFAVSLPLFFLLNTTRIGLIMLLWFVFNSDAAESFHLVGGVIMVTIGTIILLLIGEKLFGIPYIRARSSPLRCRGCDISSSADEPFCLACGRPLIQSAPKVRGRTILSLLMLTLVGSLVFYASTVSATVDTTKGIESLDIHQVKGPETVPFVLPKVSTYEPVFAYRDTATESVLNQDLALAYRYVSGSNSTSGDQPTIMYAGIQISNGKHTWEDSLITYPSSVGRPTAKVIALEDTPISADKTGRFFMYQRAGSNATEAVVYWFERLPFNFGSHFENRNVFIVLWTYTDNLARQHLIDNSNDVAAVKNFLVSFSRPVSDYWDGIASHAIAYTFLNDFMNRNYSTLIILIILPTSAILVYRYIRSGAVNLKYEKIYQGLTLQTEKNIIRATSELQTPTVGRMVAAKYGSLVPSKPEMYTLVSLLKNARDAGFLQGVIITRNDMPYLAWKSRI